MTTATATIVAPCINCGQPQVAKFPNEPLLCLICARVHEHPIVRARLISLCRRLTGG